MPAPAVGLSRQDLGDPETAGGTGLGCIKGTFGEGATALGAFPGAGPAFL